MCEKKAQTKQKKTPAKPQVFFVERMRIELTTS